MFCNKKYLNNYLVIASYHIIKRWNLKHHHKSPEERAIPIVPFKQNFQGQNWHFRNWGVQVEIEGVQEEKSEPISDCST